jgi:hypothetical protein
MDLDRCLLGGLNNWRTEIIYGVEILYTNVAEKYLMNNPTGNVS